MTDRFNMLGRLAAGVAHDLANYLGVVDLSLAAMQRRLGGGDPRAELINAREATEHALRLTSCMLAYARGCTPAPVAIDIEALVRRLLTVFGRVIPNEVDVEVELERELPAIEGVVPQIEQLLLNLVINACEVMPGGGTLRVAAWSGADTVTLEVADTGCGMAEAGGADGALSPSSKRDGSGLGLGIVREVAARHHARVLVIPRTGGGTSVQVIFPGPGVAQRT
ncbi:MAG TPA: ATP-binding protein [Kofleriaceae bacterium]|nr:ATP-binding protein [Kofleriaceae bacterium]